MTITLRTPVDLVEAATDPSAGRVRVLGSELLAERTQTIETAYGSAHRAQKLPSGVAFVGYVVA